MTDIQWRDPEPGRRGPGSTLWSRIADQLRARPEEWAVVKANAPGTSAGTYAKRTFGPGFEVTTRRATEGEGFDIYARFVGEQ